MTENGFRSRKILVADDKDESRHQLAGMLRQGGYVPVEVDLASKALQKIRDGAVAAAVVDAELPDKSGLEVLRELKRNGPRPPLVPIILATDSFNNLRSFRAAKQGASGYLTRPFAPVDLFRALTEAFAERQEQAERQEPIAVPSLSQKELEERQCQAQKLETVGRLAGGIVHDFNNLLTVVIGYAELIKAALGPKHSLYVPAAEIALAGHKGAALSRQLLAFSRNQPMEVRTLDLNAAVAAMETFLARLLGEAIFLRTRLSVYLDTINADPSQIDQILLNLVVNARDAMPHGGGLTLETFNYRLYQDRPDLAAGDYVVLRVSDTGCGMDEETQHRLFEPFFTTKERGQGTGLGLSTLAHIVAQNGGSVTVASQPGFGSSFTVYWPRARQVLLPHLPPAG